MHHYIILLATTANLALPHPHIAIAYIQTPQSQTIQLLSHSNRDYVQVPHDSLQKI